MALKPTPEQEAQHRELELVKAIARGRGNWEVGQVLQLLELRLSKAKEMLVLAPPSEVACLQGEAQALRRLLRDIDRAATQLIQEETTRAP
jgi:hypothetical protein